MWRLAEARAPTWEGDAMTRMRIVDLWTCPKSESPMVLLEDEGRSRWLAFYLPMNEANRLARSLRRTHCSYVPVFDLLERLADATHLLVLRAELHGDDRGVTAALVFRGGDGPAGAPEMTLPCHPGDALALATRAGAPIVATDAAMAHTTAADHTLRADTVRLWLNGLKPSDFAESEKT
jgi:bifunctional DNase/RNase